jgi:poly(3-hydroxybutyrate) depolymerase
MAQRLANEASAMVAATASMSLHLLVPEADDYTPVPVMILMGTEDDLYESGELTGARGNFEVWKTMNDCMGDPVETWRDGNSYALTFKNCRDGTEVTLVTIEGGGHVLYEGQGTDINTSRLAWNFMKKFNK